MTQDRPAIHPRIRDRWVAVRRTEGRRRFRRSLVLLVVLSVVVLGWWVTRSSLLDVDGISVTGNAHTSAADVAAAAAVAPGTPLLEVPRSAVAERVARLPWVDEVEVRRRFPGTVRIEVTERSPVALADAADGGLALVDGSGRVLEILDASVLAGVGGGSGGDGLVRLEGIAPVTTAGEHLDEMAAPLLVVAESLGDALLAETSTLRLDDTSVVLVLAGGGEVLLGPPSDLDAKLMSLETVLARVDRTGLRQIDVRVPEAPVVRRS